MKGPIPNVIGLPYGRAPPLHMKAPNWRDMLKLMARLSSTRLEPTVEALALVKIPMQLRVVINFVKVRRYGYGLSLGIQLTRCRYTNYRLIGMSSFT